MKKILIVVIFTIFSFNCFSITILLKDNNQLSGEIKKIDKKKIYISPSNSENLFIVNKFDIQSIMDGEIDLTVDILTQKPHGRINYNSYTEVINIKLDENGETSDINHTSNEIPYNEYIVEKTKNSIFDDKRKGFIFGFGAGGHLTSFDQEIMYDEGIFMGGTVSKKGLATDFRIGYSPRYDIEIFYVSKISWFTIVNIYGESVTISDGVGALGFSHFFSEKINPEKWIKSPYFSLGFGYSAWSTPLISGSSSSIGLGIYAAVGYELNKHSRVEFSFFKNNTSYEENGVELLTNSTAFMLLFNYMQF